MKRTRLLVLILSGLSAISTNITREYHYVKELKTWAEAQSYCRETFTDLATVHNQDDNDRLLSVLEGLGEYAWIGLCNDKVRWIWAQGHAEFNNDTDFSNWGPNEPHYKYSKTSCILMTQDGLWRESKCWNRRPAVCYYEQGPSTYILVQNQMKWLQAKRYCQSKYTDLVSVRNMSENNHVSPLLSEGTWIGLQGKHWGYWSDRRPRTFVNWHKNQPDNDEETHERKSCAVVNTTTGRWWGVDCEAKHYFICQNELHPRVQHKTTLKLKFQSEADLNDPAVQQQMLEQLHAKLEKHGLPDFQLRWIQTHGQTFHKEQKRKKEEGSGG